MRVAAHVVLLVALFGGTSVACGGQHVDVQNDDIVSVSLGPYPEGPPGPTFMRGPRPPGFYFALQQIEPFIPDPLPDTLSQGFNCEPGGNLVVTIRDGGTITYGPCRRPASINALWARMVEIATDGQCLPGCGPGLSG